MCPDLPAATQKQIYGNVVVPGAAGDVPRRATQEDQQVIPVPQPQPRQGQVTLDPSGFGEIGGDNTGAAAGFATFGGTELQAHLVTAMDAGTVDHRLAKVILHAMSTNPYTAALLTRPELGTPEQVVASLLTKIAPSAEASAMLADASVRPTKPRAAPAAPAPAPWRQRRRGAGPAPKPAAKSAPAPWQHVPRAGARAGAAPAPACGAGARARGIGGGGGAGARRGGAVAPAVAVGGQRERASVAGAAVSHRVVPRRSPANSPSPSPGRDTPSPSPGRDTDLPASAAAVRLRRRRRPARRTAAGSSAVSDVFGSIFGESTSSAPSCCSAHRSTAGSSGTGGASARQFPRASAGAVSERGCASKSKEKRRIKDKQP